MVKDRAEAFFIMEYQMSVRVKTLFLVEKALSLGLDINVKGYGGEKNKISYRDTDIRGDC